ncbi:MAG: zinc ribbon domain-containing protein [Actinobacteria bacterium]|nr:zinc ribbon domain-containing protein [Actinomycetota bacterium]
MRVRADPTSVEDPYADLLGPAAVMRCPACAAALRPGAPWCTLCYADLRPAAAPVPEPVVARATAHAALDFDPLTAPAQALGLPASRAAGPDLAAISWPCMACETSNPYTVSVCTACGSAFLAGLREAEGPLLELPGVGDLTKLSRGQRLGLAAGVVLAISVFTALVGLVFS